MQQGTFLIPPVLYNSDNTLRAAGFEFEFGNLGVEQVAEKLQQALGGNLTRHNAFNCVLKDSALGELKIERDASLLSSLKYREWLQDLGIEQLAQLDSHKLDQEIDQLSRWLIPCEIVTAPIPLNALQPLEELAGVLLQLDAQGTQSAPHYAFGLHINPSIIDSSTTGLLRFLQAFLLLSDWIIDNASTDLTRRFFTKYIDPFPDHYYQYILSSEYAPDQDTFIRDYLRFNPTRNRPLDLLPLFDHLDTALLSRLVSPAERKLIKPRPTFHYRLPDCRLGDPQWSIAQEWNRWWLVESVACSDQWLATLLTAWQEHQQHHTFRFRSKWIETTDAFLQARFSELPPARQ